MTEQIDGQNTDTSASHRNGDAFKPTSMIAKPMKNR
jgi:hypothetical protein